MEKTILDEPMTYGSVMNYDKRVDASKVANLGVSEQVVNNFNEVIDTITRGEIKTIFGFTFLLSDIFEYLNDYANKCTPEEFEDRVKLASTTFAVDTIGNNILDILLNGLDYESKGEDVEEPTNEGEEYSLINLIKDKTNSLSNGEDSEEILNALSRLEYLVRDKDFKIAGLETVLEEQNETISK